MVVWEESRLPPLSTISSRFFLLPLGCSAGFGSGEGLEISRGSGIGRIF